MRVLFHLTSQHTRYIIRIPGTRKSCRAYFHSTPSYSGGFKGRGLWERLPPLAQNFSQ